MPTDCNSQPIVFTPLGRREPVAQFDGGQITSNAGALLLREIATRSNLFGRILVRYLGEFDDCFASSAPRDHLK